ncbi:MAG: TrmH family RNA methyltransferase [Desulfarculaceae bacterium]|jgi:tRNA/rRNA methyltransferase
MPDCLQNLVVILVRPRFPENLGACARVVANMGLGGLRAVAPERLWEKPMQRLATDQGREVLEGMQVFPSLQEALGDCVAAAATTARPGVRRGRLLTPRQAVSQVLDWTGEGKAAIVFGPEDRGLDTVEVDQCTLTVSIPTTEAASLNLAQAVMVLAYELRLAALAEKGRVQGQATAPPRARASLEEMEALKEHLMEALVAINVLRRDNPSHFFRPFKNVLDRAALSPAEVRTLRGVARQILWLVGRLEKNGE